MFSSRVFLSEVGRGTHASSSAGASSGSHPPSGGKSQGILDPKLIKLENFEEFKNVAISFSGAEDVILITDPRSGLTMEFAMYKGYRKVRYEVGLAWGVVL